MELESVFVTGANRGIGLEFVRQLALLPNPPKYVFASYRNKESAKDLEYTRDASSKSQVILIQMDVTKLSDIQAAKKAIEEVVKDDGLTLLINNAGAARTQGFADITEENLLFHFTTNTMGPVLVSKEMFPLLEKAATLSKTPEMSVSKSAVLTISSSAGSMGLLTEPTASEFLEILGYRTSKAALNMAMRVVALTVKEHGILVVQMCPGWVKTDMGTDRGRLEVSESVASMLNTLPQLNKEHHGVFLDRKGITIPF